MQKTDVIVIGGGAAGLMCAMEAGRRGRGVVVLDHAEHLGRKIAVSGGGRCNFTNLHAGPENYLSQNPDFCKSALARYTPRDFIALVERHGVPYHEKKLGQQFCDASARQILHMLLDECRAARVDIRTGAQVVSVEKNAGFAVHTRRGGFSCDSLVVATGGLSFSKLGATDFGHRLARQFGLKVTPLRPALVPLTFFPEDLSRFRELSGVSLPVAVRHRGMEFREQILFTHRGLSGPAILQISSYWRDGETLEINLLPDLDAGEWLAGQPGRAISPASLLAGHLPRRFAEVWCQQQGLSKPLNRFKAAELRAAGRLLNRWTIRMRSTEGYAKAEVTLGGVDTSELSSKTMESRNVRGLYFAGEVMDVTGWLGGFNFQWAWASGHAAGQSV
jgi:predicted Rossmann fold flavoprotein